jgi:hypothetical protein
MMPYGKHCSVKGSLSRTGVDMAGSISLIETSFCS